MINAFRDVDLLRTVRELLSRVSFIEDLTASNRITISGGDFSDTVHDVDLDGGTF